MSAAIDTASLPPEQDASTSDAARENERQRSVAEFFRETWSQALVAVSATEEEAQKILGKLTTWFEVGPEEARRLGQELSDRLLRERRELEDTIEVAVRRALTPFRLPSREDLSLIHARMTELEARVDRLLARRVGAAAQSADTNIAQ
jgi:polyhydroxyalkanoate synthesis regulator phasin